ncbi:MAG TPA: c-type cytochrome biogenesis protein CcmI [Ktedonobacteraceae bacterium]|nr:c-type cytochrome biogenesis protein CcmI [Ktedonobacteraceae bacterium]
MQPISFIVAALVGLIALAFVLYPLYRRPANPALAPAPEARSLSEREQNARQALQEVEFDFQLGNLDEKEYRSLRTRYMNRALVEMKNRHQRETELDDEIEAELHKLKETASKGTASQEEVSDE